MMQLTEKLEELQKQTRSVKQKYVCLYNPAEVKFWCSESGNPINCSRQWVQEWELFSIIDDSYSGAQLIRSNQTKKYAQVNNQNNKLYCTAASAVQQARFTVEGNGAVKAYNGQFVYTPNGGGDLTASSAIPVEYGIYDVMEVAIANADRTLYARPGNVKGEPRIVMDSKTPVTFYVIIDSDNTCYFETSGFEFLMPENSVDALTYKKTPIECDLYRFKVQEPTEQADYWTLYSESMKSYVGWDTATEGTILHCGYSDTKALATHFQLVPV